MKLQIKHILAIALCVSILGYVLSTQFAEPQQIPPDPQPTAVFSFMPTMTSEGPVSYFVNNCTRCHGPTENAYAEFPVPRRGDELRKMLVVMAEGPAMSASDPETLEQQYQLHLAIIDKAPYIWIDPSQTDVIAGELIESTDIYLQTPQGRVKAATDGYRFALPNQPGKIVIERNGKSRTIDR